MTCGSNCLDWTVLGIGNWFCSFLIPCISELPRHSPADKLKSRIFCKCLKIRTPYYLRGGSNTSWLSSTFAMCSPRSSDTPAVVQRWLNSSTTLLIILMVLPPSSRSMLSTSPCLTLTSSCSARLRPRPVAKCSQSLPPAFSKSLRVHNWSHLNNFHLCIPNWMMNRWPGQLNQDTFTDTGGG